MMSSFSNKMEEVEMPIKAKEDSKIKLIP